MNLGATKYIGARIARREDLRFLTGRTRYVDDIRLPRTVHAAFVRSPYAHAEVQAMRTDRAARLEGVMGTLTGEEATASPDRSAAIRNGRGGKAPTFRCSAGRACIL